MSVDSKAQATTKSITLRSRRQITLPADMCDALGIQVGDSMELSVEDEGVIRIKPKKAVALEALREIQRAFAAASVTEAEIQTAGRRARKRLSRRYDGGN